MNDLRYLFINISRSKKYVCRVTKSCVFKLLQNVENSLQNYPENPGNCVSWIPDFKIFPGEHVPGSPYISRAEGARLSFPTSMLWCRHCCHAYGAVHMSRANRTDSILSPLMLELNTEEGFMAYTAPEDAQRPRAVYAINPDFRGI